MEALSSHAKYMQLLLLSIFTGNLLYVDKHKNERKIICFFPVKT